MRLLCIDTNLLGMLCNPRQDRHPELKAWFAGISANAGAFELSIPEICDYELRRKLLHLALREGRSISRSLDLLDRLSQSLTFLELSRPVMKQAARLWAEARMQGIPTASSAALDGDVILAAQALEVGGTVVTTNRRHLERFVQVADWQEIQP